MLDDSSRLGVFVAKKEVVAFYCFLLIINVFLVIEVARIFLFYCLETPS
jgi:hypothetical protein